MAHWFTHQVLPCGRRDASRQLLARDRYIYPVDHRDWTYSVHPYVELFTSCANFSHDLNSCHGRQLPDICTWHRSRERGVMGYTTPG